MTEKEVNLTMKPTLKISLPACRLMALCGLLALGSAAQAQPPRVSCSTRTLQGDYGFTIEGQILAGPFAGPVRGIAMTHFDGQGRLSQVDHVVGAAGPPPIEWTPSSGTYTVNPDCTGTAQFVFPDGRVDHLRLVVVKSGAEVRTVVSAVGFSVTSVGVRRDGPPF